MCWVENLKAERGELSYRVMCVMRHPRRSYMHSISPLLSLNVTTTPETHVDLLDAVIRTRNIPPLQAIPAVVECGSAFLRFTGTPRGASRMVQPLSAWSPKNRRSPSRHCRGARVYGHTTTPMHDEHTLSPICRPPHHHYPPLMRYTKPREVTRQKYVLLI